MLHFNVRMLKPGEAYGRSGKLVADKAMIEFYDPRFLHEELGQFVTRYYVDTLLANRDTLEDRGLCLDGSISAWNVSNTQMREIFASIEEGAA